MVSKAQNQAALKRFELENNIQDKAIFDQTDETIQKLLYSGYNFREKPWKKDPDHFKKVMISAVALIKMSMHACAGGKIEVMGCLQGYPIGDTMWIMDVYALPVEASETRVNATADADSFMIDFNDMTKKVDRPEYNSGWYHSHPGYKCWLSGIDVTT